MRSLAVVSLALLASCTLYFGENAPEPGHSPDAGPVHDSGPGPDSWDPPPPGPADTFARCEDGQIYLTSGALAPGDTPGHGAGIPMGTCAGGCRSAVAECTNGNCTQAFATLCGAPPATGAACAQQGLACSGSGTVGCSHTTACGTVVAGGTCTCNGTSYACTDTTGTAGVHAKLVGKWRGMVMPPSFTSPYPVSIWIYPDGTYWAECSTTAYCNAFYYGGDGPHPWRRIKVLSSSQSLGAWADIGVFYSHNIGSLSSLFVTDTTLTFTYHAAWHGCSQPFYFSLTRE